MIPYGGMLWRSLFVDRVEEDISDFCGQHIRTVLTSFDFMVFLLRPTPLAQPRR